MNKLNAIFLELGLKEGLLGTGYLRLAAGMYAPGMSLTKELYPAIAKAAGTTPSRAERAMRHAIEAAFDNAGDEIMRRYFGNTISYKSGKVTVGEFLARVAVLCHED